MGQYNALGKVSVTIFLMITVLTSCLPLGNLTSRFSSLPLDPDVNVAATGPDLVWLNILITPTNPVSGQTVDVFFHLKNQGTDTSATIVHFFYLDGNYLGWGSNNGLEAGAISYFHFTCTVGPGYHTFRAYADYLGTVEESNEGNNNFQKTFWWKAPDLVVQDIVYVDCYGTTPSTITSGQPFSVYIIVRNAGDLFMSEVATVKLYLDGLACGETNCWGLNPGETRILVFQDLYSPNPYLGIPGSHSIFAVVDPSNTLEEANTATGSGIGTAETNNNRTEWLPVVRAKWTVLAYLDGDNDLEGAMIDYFEEIARVGSTESLSLVVEMDRAPEEVMVEEDDRDDTSYGNWIDCRRFFVTRNQDPTIANTLEALGEVRMNEQATLEDFLTWGAGRFQAEHYYVIISDHGLAWQGCCTDRTSSMIESPPVKTTTLRLNEIGNSLSAMKRTIGHDIDVVLFDTCLMGSIEVMSQIYPYVDYAVASETSLWMLSFKPYNNGEGSLEYLKNHPEVSPSTLAVTITNRAGLTNDDDIYEPTCAIAAYNLSKMGDLFTSMNLLATHLREKVRILRDLITTARQGMHYVERTKQGPPVTTQIDLYELVLQLYMWIEDSDIQEVEWEILTMLSPLGGGGGEGYLVMEERHTPAADFCRGLSIYFPYPSWNPYEQEYSRSDKSGTFMSNTLWDEFLAAYNDTVAPYYASIIINNGDAYATSTSVTLNLNAQEYDDGSGPGFMSFSNNGNSWTDWEPYTLSKAWTLIAGYGTRHVYFKVMDYAGNIANTASDIIYLDPYSPTGSITINQDENWTVSRVVILTLTYSDAGSGVAQVRYSNDGTAWTSWESPSTSKTWYLPYGDGIKWIYYQVQDVVGWISPTYSDNIILDASQPYGSISINNGAAWTTTRSVTLQLTYYDTGSGVDQVSFSNDGSLWTVWLSPTPTRNWTLQTGEGTKTVYYRIRDKAGGISLVKSDSIGLDTIQPTGSIVINGNASRTTSTSVILTLAYSDAGSGVDRMSFSEDGINWNPWEALSTSKNWTLESGFGARTIYFRVSDEAANISQTYSDSIYLTSPI